MANGIDPVQSMKTLKYKGAVMRGRARRGAIGLMAAAIGGYVAICAYMYLRQDALVYPGGTTAVHPLPAPEAAGLEGYRAVTLDTPDGEHLNGWWRAPDPGRGVIVYLHGNTTNLAIDWRVARLKAFAEAGFGVLGVEYRGFGGSTGHPSEPGLITDAETAYDYAASHASGAKIALFGDSLGTGAAIALATQRPVTGLILDSPYASATRQAHIAYPWLPTSLLLRDGWDSESRIKSVHAPILIAHCDADKRIPLSEGQRLFDAANQPKEMVVLTGCGHVETWVDPAKAKILTDFGTWLATN